ncbi:MAG: hypothetical protein KA118_20025, partial [Verrucomicrobia bacterium]|nr:hypothetical protein [Verrucomicrobiota bacterium]
EPGARAIRVAPHLGDLEWAEGAWPTPFGPVKVRHEKRADGTVESRIDAPPQVRVIRP